MLTVCCVFDPNRFYGEEYVVKLRSMVSKHINASYNFYCVTSEYIPFVDCVQPPVKLSGRWLKFCLFHPEMATILGDDILYLDLDTIICGSLDNLVDLPGSFLAPRSKFRAIDGSKLMLSNIMRWRGQHNHVWTYFTQNESSIDKTLDDYSIIENAIGESWIDLLDLLPRNFILDWTENGLRYFESLDDFRKTYPECAIITFNDIPKIREAAMFRSFLDQIWR